MGLGDYRDVNVKTNEVGGEVFNSVRFRDGGCVEHVQCWRVVVVARSCRDGGLPYNINERSWMSYTSLGSRRSSTDNHRDKVALIACQYRSAMTSDQLIAGYCHC